MRSSGVDQTHGRLIVSEGMLNNNRHVVVVCLVSLLVYFALGAAFYMPACQFSFTQYMFFSAQTITTNGIGDAIPAEKWPRLVTCLFMLSGVVLISTIFSELTFILLLSHRDEAVRTTAKELKLEERPLLSRLGRFSLGPPIERDSASSTNPVAKEMNREIELNLWSCFYLVVEFIVLTGVAVFLFVLIEGWSWFDALFFAIPVLLTTGYGKPIPTTVIGKWAVTVFMLVGCSIMANIVANLVSLPGLYHRWTSDKLVLSQFDPTMDPQALDGREDAEPMDAAEALRNQLLANHMTLGSGALVAGASKPRAAAPGRSGGSDVARDLEPGEASSLGEVFGEEVVAKSGEHVHVLASLIKHPDRVTRDEFSLWLLYLLDRCDVADIRVVRRVYSKLMTLFSDYSFWLWAIIPTPFQPSIP